MIKYHDVSELVTAVFSDYRFLPWRFTKVSRSFWQSATNRRNYVEWLKHEVGVASETDLKARHFLENHGSSLLVAFNNSLSEVLFSLNVESDHPSPSSSSSPSPSSPSPSSILKSNKENILLGKVPRKRKFWNSIANQKQFAELLGKKLGYFPSDEEQQKDGYDYRKYLPNFYKVSTKDFHENGGAGLITARYSNSPYLFLKAVFPEYHWLPWEFNMLPRSAASDPTVIQEVIDYVFKTLRMKTLDDWYRVSNAALSDLGVWRFFEKGGGLGAVLQRFYPMHDWSEEAFSRVKKHRKKKTKGEGEM